MNNYYGIDLERKREALLKCKAARPLVEGLIKKADAALEKVYSHLTMSEYMLYYETGDRKTFEKRYYERRDDCVSISAALWLTNDEKYIRPLIDVICVICDEYTWCLPPHADMEHNPSLEGIASRIDLANGETAKVLTEIAVINGDKLPPYVNERISYEVRRRIIAGLRNKCGWERSTSNWASVCACCSAVALLHFGTEDEIAALMPKLYKAIDNFLLGYEDDGCCKEGMIYWSYGFGHFLYFAWLVYTYSGGERNYFINEKVKSIAMFPQKMRMGKTKVYCVSDSRQDYYADVKNLSFLRQIYGNDILYPQLELGAHQDNIFSVTELLWFDTDYIADERTYDTSYFENSQLYIKRMKNYSFAAKGGTNGVPHNHNDVGSFMIVDSNDDIPIADVGRGEYRKETFDPELRYTLFVNGSQGHCVPIVNGEYQMAGPEYRALNVKAGNDFFSLDIEGAYKAGLIKKIRRGFELYDNSIVMTDVFDHAADTHSICERLVSWDRPQIYDGYVMLGKTKVVFEKDRYMVEVGSESYDSRMGIDGVITAHYIDFKPYECLPKSFSIKIILE